MKKLLPVLALFVAAASLAQNTKKLEKLAATITPADLKAKLSVIAGPEMEGRETATSGQKKAASFIENYFAKLGLQPGTKDGFQMQFPVYQDSLASASLTINGRSLIMGSDYKLSSFSLANGNFTTDTVVFAFFCINDSLGNYYIVLDVKNRWVMVAEGIAADAEKPAGAVNYGYNKPGALYTKIYQARSLGAKGLIVIAKPFTTNGNGALKGNMTVKQTTANNMPLLYITEEVAGAMLGTQLASFADIKKVTPGNYPAAVSFISIERFVISL